MLNLTLRQDILHHVRVLALDGKLFRAPIPSNPHHVLDLGTGTGIWAIDFADEFPSAQVVGTDLSPIQPSWVPPNLTFMVDDIEADWLEDWSDMYDFIHGRDLGGSVSDWAKLYAQAFRCVKPGGWIEMQEFEVWIKSDDDTLKKAPSLIRLQELIDEASTKLGKQMNVANEQKQKVIDAGFEDVTDDVYKVGVCRFRTGGVYTDMVKIPISTWPKDKKLRQLGLYTGETFMAACESYSLALLTRVLGWTVEEVKVLIANTRRELKDRGLHAYANMHFIYGRKPMSG